MFCSHFHVRHQLVPSGLMRLGAAAEAATTITTTSDPRCTIHGRPNGIAVTTTLPTRARPSGQKRCPSGRLLVTDGIRFMAVRGPPTMRIFRKSTFFSPFVYFPSLEWILSFVLSCYMDVQRENIKFPCFVIPRRRGFPLAFLSFHYSHLLLFFFKLWKACFFLVCSSFPLCNNLS